jgi:hypothetical protein
MKYAVHFALISAFLFVALPLEASTNDRQAQAEAQVKAQALSEFAQTQTESTAAAAFSMLTENVKAASDNEDLKSFGCISLTQIPKVTTKTSDPDLDDFVLIAPAAIGPVSYRSPAEASASVQTSQPVGDNFHEIYRVQIRRDVEIFVLSFTWHEGTNAQHGLCPSVPQPVQQVCPCDQNGKSNGNTTLAEGDCIEAIFIRELKDATGNLIPAAILTNYNMVISTQLIEESGRSDFPTMVIDGFAVRSYFPPGSSSQKTGGQPTYNQRSGWAFGGRHHFEVYSAATSCRLYNSDAPDGSIDAGTDVFKKINWVDNQITVSHPHVYDSFSLRQKLASTAAALASISGFNSASVNSAIGNLQGVTSDVSYLTAQVTAGFTPSSVTTAAAANNVLTTTTPLTGSTTNTVTTTCPSGYIPTLGAGSAVTCTAGTAGTNYPVIQTTLAAPAGGSSTVATANPATTQTVTTNPSITAAVPSAPTSTTPSAPTNQGASASDILTEQVQLNSQITTLQMALQGSLSDQYLVKQGKVVGQRAQTTLGFDINLNHPERYKHAVAEVRVWVYPVRSGDSMSVISLLPAAKTYNVAKITSNQKAFGAGVVIDAVSVGANGGKTKNRLYLAKDTDTVALQYSPNSNPTLKNPWKFGADLIGRSPQEHVLDGARVIAAWQKITDACDDDPGPDFLLNGKETSQEDLPLVFGWQFRPVLGANYVQGGDRQVFAQLALPVGFGNQYTPLVFVQTRWRVYDSKNQVVGAVYEGSCSVHQDLDPIVVDSPLEVHSVDVNDMGGGIVKVSADGSFFEPGFSVMSGPNLIGPAPMDGKHIQFFATAASLLLMDDLKLLAENGKTTALAIKTADGADCAIRKASLNAVPRPDGTSLVEARVISGSSYDLSVDKTPHPLFLIGSQVYGLHETPFLEPPRTACHPLNKGSDRGKGGIHCIYHFLAPTSSLRTAETFTVRDLAWAQFKKTGTIELDPSFSGLTSLVTVKASDGNSMLSTSKAGVANKPAPPRNKSGGKDSASQSPPVFTLSGTDFQRIRNWNCSFPGCLEVYQGFEEYSLGSSNFKTFGRTAATIAFGSKAVPPTCTATFAPGTPIKYNINLDSKTPDAKIFYSIGGGDLTPYSKTAFSVPTNTTINSYAVADGDARSVESTWTIPSPDCPTPAKAKAKAQAQTADPANTSTSPQLTYASYRFVWHPHFGGAVVWDLSPPKNDAAASSATPLLNEGDVTDITFSGVDIWNDPTTISFSFNGMPLVTPSPLFSYDAAKKTLKFYVTSDMTSKPGHKVIVLNAKKGTSSADLSAAQVLLEFDVTKR